MKQFPRDLVLFLFVQATLLGGILALFYRPASANPLVASTNLKHRLLDESPPPRVVFVGGSNILYGLDCPTIKKRLGMNPINMGLIGGLRLDYLLSEVEPNVRPGDLVVLALEYNQLIVHFRSKRSAVILAQLLENRPLNALYLSWRHVRKLSDYGVISQLGFALRAAIRQARRINRARDEAPPAINEFGDLLEHRDKPMRERVRQHRPMVRRFDDAALGWTIARLNRFHQRCLVRGATVVYTFPPLPQPQYARLADPVERIEARLRAELTLPVINRPRDMVFPLDQFYDSANHLRGQGVFDRSNRLADAIRSHLEKENLLLNHQDAKDTKKAKRSKGGPH